MRKRTIITGTVISSFAFGCGLASLGYRQPKRVETEDGLPEVFATNVLAP